MKPVLGEPTRLWNDALQAAETENELRTLKQPSEHNCVKRTDKGIFPTELHW